MNALAFQVYYTPFGDTCYTDTDGQPKWGFANPAECGSVLLWSTDICSRDGNIDNVIDNEVRFMQLPELTKESEKKKETKSNLINSVQF